MTGTGRLVAGLIVLSGFVVAGCTSDGEAPEGNASGPENTEVIGERGAGTSVEAFEVRRQGRRFTVRFFDRGEGVRTITVSARSFRGIDRGDARLAYDAAFEAANRVDCGNGAPVNVFGETATFQEEGRRSAFTSGEPAWIFQGRCGA